MSKNTKRAKHLTRAQMRLMADVLGPADTHPHVSWREVERELGLQPSELTMDNPRWQWLVNESPHSRVVDQHAEASLLLSEAVAPVWHVDGKRVR